MSAPVFNFHPPLPQPVPAPAPVIVEQHGFGGLAIVLTALISAFATAFVGMMALMSNDNMPLKDKQKLVWVDINPVEKPVNAAKQKVPSGPGGSPTILPGPGSPVEEQLFKIEKKAPKINIGSAWKDEEPRKKVYEEIEDVRKNPAHVVIPSPPGFPPPIPDPLPPAFLPNPK